MANSDATKNPLRKTRKKTVRICSAAISIAIHSERAASLAAAVNVCIRRGYVLSVAWWHTTEPLAHDTDGRGAADEDRAKKDAGDDKHHHPSNDEPAVAFHERSGEKNDRETR